MDNRAVRIRYHTRNQMQEEKEELGLGPAESPYVMMLLPS